MRATSRQSGLTLVEAVISLGVTGILLSSVLSITVETSSFLGDNETDVTLLTEGSRAFERLTDVLRKSGRSSTAGVNYPRVVSGGTELEFRLLADIDGNGFPFEASTGALEWNPKVFTARTDGNAEFWVFDGSTPVYLLGRFIRDLNFETVSENPALHLKEIHVRFRVERQGRVGATLSRTVDGTVNMRN
jgi:type II secretory pathway pseudopilin PulG